MSELLLHRVLRRSAIARSTAEDIVLALAADIRLAIDHFRYFAGCIRAQEGSLSKLDENTVAYHFHEPHSVVGQIIP